MKYLEKLRIILLSIAYIGCFSACSNQDLDEDTDITEKHTIPLNLVCDLIEFKESGSTKQAETKTSATSFWTDGARIYITFYNGAAIIPGEAVYNAENGWSISYEGNLPMGNNLKCEARYFTNATFSSSSLISLNAYSGIYEDLNAVYSYDNNSLTVQTILAPKNGRIRFICPSADNFHLTGLSVYTTFVPTINKFSTSDAMVTVNRFTTYIDNTTYSDYIYGQFSNSERYIGIIRSEFAYTRTCTPDILQPGESGYMTMPSENAHNKWRTGLYIKTSGVEFKMIPVAGYSGGFFLIAETETTTALYNSVNGSPSSDQSPISSISYSEITSFIEKLNNQTHLNFDLPTKEQWQYAAKGGNKSQNYTYAGSNIPGDVAWYSANTSSKQNVKQKAPNELGIYDMSGNVGEFVKTMYASYPYILGGAYCSSSDYIKRTSNVYTYLGTSAGYTNFRSEAYCYYDSPYCKDPAVGFRLILTCP